MKLLLVDANSDDLLLTCQQLRMAGYQVTTASSSSEALDIFKREYPDVVLTDICMSGMDGFELAAAIQNVAAPRWQPVVFLSARCDDAIRVRALEIGVDSCITKPATLKMLDAKLRSLKRLITLQRHAEERTDALERYHAIEEEEKGIAKQLIERFVSSAKLNDPALQYWVRSADGFSGDVVAAARTPANLLHVMLADGTGHGLAASINVLPIAPPFYGMTEKGFGLDSIARELNTKVREFLPVERFVAATLVAFDFREGVIRVWNGGNPAPFLIDAAGRKVHQFTRSYVPLGVLEDGDFNPTLETTGLVEGTQFVAFSDGLLEAGSHADQPFGYAAVADTLSRFAPDKRMASLKQTLATYIETHGVHDDISLVIVDCKRDATHTYPGYGGGTEESTTENSTHDNPGNANWAFSLRLGSAELRQLDVVPMLLNLASQFEDTRPLSGELFVILSELFNNALDHGLLRLDSRLKLSETGMGPYLAQRAQRLNDLSSGLIELRLEHVPVMAGPPFLEIRCRDTGSGFDYKTKAASTVTEDAENPSELPFGRGLALVRTLCRDLQFNEVGNEVVATLSLSPRSGSA